MRETSLSNTQAHASEVLSCVLSLARREPDKWKKATLKEVVSEVKSTMGADTCVDAIRGAYDAIHHQQEEGEEEDDGEDEEEQEAEQPHEPGLTYGANAADIAAGNMARQLQKHQQRNAHPRWARDENENENANENANESENENENENEGGGGGGGGEGEGEGAGAGEGEGEGEGEGKGEGEGEGEASPWARLWVRA